jgi:hypothetical protein
VKPNIFPVLLAFLVALILSGCASAPERSLSVEPVRFASLPNGYDPLNPNQLIKRGSAGEEGAIPYYESKRGHALNILQLSGGGQYGAFGAGFLKGWRETGTRPEFDIVTGVSTGALLATHALLGTPEDDAVLQEIYTKVTAQDIFKKNFIIGLFFGSQAAYDTSPLKSLLDRHITQAVLRRVAAAYGEHRRLYVGTTNLDYNQTWVWNMGLIAKQGGPDALELYKKVLLASASPPIAFPAVEIDGHLFGDGGVRQNLVVVGLAGKIKPTPPQYGPGTIYTIQNGKQTTPPKALRNEVLSIAGPVLGTMLETSMDTLLMRSFFAAHARGYKFKYVSIPAAVEIGSNPLAFDQKQMRHTFDAGYSLGLQPDPWQDEPSVLDDIPPWALEVVRSKLK